MEIVEFMATGVGRGIRIAIGLALILVGLFVVGGTAGWIIAIVGLAPLLAGIMNVCLIAPLLKAPFRGDEALHHRH